MMQSVTRARGFSLIELMVAITIIGILSVVVTANFSTGRAQARDAERQADLRKLEVAITQYKQENGRYPEGCNGAGNWSGGTYGCTNGNNFIVGLAPTFMTKLPSDPNPGSGAGYVYTVNDEGSVYKLMAMNTVESESVTYTDPMKSCDIRPAANGSYQFVNGNNIDTGGWCAYIYPDNSDVPRCKTTADGGNGRFEKSYGVWGGFAATGGGAQKSQKVSATTAIICQ